MQLEGCEAAWAAAAGAARCKGLEPSRLEEPCRSLVAWFVFVWKLFLGTELHRLRTRFAQILSLLSLFLKSIYTRYVTRWWRSYTAKGWWGSPASGYIDNRYAGISNQFVVLRLGAWKCEDRKAGTGAGRHGPGRHRGGPVRSIRKERSFFPGYGPKGPPPLEERYRSFRSRTNRPAPLADRSVSPDPARPACGVRARGRQSDGRIGSLPFRGDEEPADGLFGGGGSS